MTAAASVELQILTALGSVWITGKIIVAVAGVFLVL